MGWTRVPARPSKGLRSSFWWIAFWVGSGVMDALVPVPFSQQLREWFHTNTPEGRAVFLGALTSLTVIFAVHILHKK